MHPQKSGTMRAFGRWAAFWAGTLIAVHGCGDGPICPSEVVVLISSASDGDTITTDTSPEPGIQSDVAVRTNLRGGERVTLTVLDSGGTEVATVEGMSDSEGNVLFAGVDMPAGLAILRAEANAGECGSGFDEVQVNVLTGGGCGLAVREGLLESEYYAPLPVLNTSNDSDPALPNFQANIDITTSASYDVELFVLDIDSATETSAGVVTAATDGSATFAITLAQGRQTLRATCTPPGGGLGASSANTPLLVDTEAPMCWFANPMDGTTVIPSMDLDNDPSNGTQITLVGHAEVGANGDLEGESAVFTIDGVPMDGSLLDIDGDSTLAATFDTPGSVALGFETQDHAGNGCQIAQTSSYVTDGCAMSLLLPTGPVTSDSNGDPTDGMQTQIVVQVDLACVGQTVVTDCGEGTSSAVVPADGTTAIDVTVCPDAQCEVSDMCTITVTNDAGIETSIGTVLTGDNVPPLVNLQFIDPVTSCGGAVPPSADVDANAANGVQIDVRVVAPLAIDRWVEATDDTGTTVTVPAQVGGDARITLAPGLNDIVAVAEDENSNQGRTGACSVALLDIVIGFAPPIDDGLVGASDGAVSGNQVTFDVCGTVSELGATIDVSIDGGPAQPAVVTGTNWCLNNITLDESTQMNPFHTIDVSATTGMQFGAASRNVVVDLTPAPPVGNLSGTANTRQSIALSWVAPSDDGAAAASYLVKIADTPIDDGNFDMVGTEIAAFTPSAPGVTEALLVEQLLAGTEYYIGVAARDAAGNRSLAQIVGPLTPDFDATGGIPAMDASAGDNALGYQIAHGDFNGDGFSDLAVSAPFKAVDLNSNGTFEGSEFGVGTVYVYFGSAAGIGNPLDPPDVTIEGATSGGQFGNGLAALEWGGDGSTDLAIGVPFGDNSNGRVYVFHGGPGFSMAGGPADADVTIGSAGGWFGFGAMGWTLTSARFNSDTNDDLVIAVPGGGGGVGGIAVVFGGHGETTINLSELDPVPSGSATTLVVRDPDPTLYDIFGQTLVNLGRTGGAGDLRDDIGVAYPDGNSVYVIRGRAKPATPGVTLSNVNLASDLEIQDDSTDTTEVHFGSSMGSIADLNGDGARDIVIGAWAEGQSGTTDTYNGRVRIVDGDAVGTRDVGAISFATITPSALSERHFGAAVVNNVTARGSADVNNDGQEDLLIVGGFGTSVTMYVWYGGGIPTGTVTSNSADHTILAPSSFVSSVGGSSGTPMVAIWAGDMNNDGLEDICWGDFTANNTDGAFEVLWDDGL